jgi:hypothetical protein
MGITTSSDRSDVVETGLDHAVLTVGTTITEVKVGASRNATRQIVVIYNESNNRTLWWGKSSVASSGSGRGFPILPGQSVSLPVGDIGIYIIGEASGQTAWVAEIG